MPLCNTQSIDIFVKDEKLNDLKILHLSDLHIDKKTTVEKVQRSKRLLLILWLLQEIL